jgi:hypothetical protein
LVVLGLALAPGRLAGPPPSPANAAIGVPATGTSATLPTPPIGKTLDDLQPSLVCTIDPSRLEYAPGTRVQIGRCEARAAATTVYGPFERVQGLRVVTMPTNEVEVGATATVMATCIAGATGEKDRTALRSWIVETASKAPPGSEAPAAAPRQGELAWSSNEAMRFAEEDRTYGGIRVRLRHAHESGGAKRRMVQLIVGRDVSELE